MTLKERFRQSLVRHWLAWTSGPQPIPPADGATLSVLQGEDAVKTPARFAEPGTTHAGITRRFGRLVGAKSTLLVELRLRRLSAFRVPG